MIASVAQRCIYQRTQVTTQQHWRVMDVGALRTAVCKQTWLTNANVFRRIHAQDALFAKKKQHTTHSQFRCWRCLNLTYTASLCDKYTARETMHSSVSKKKRCQLKSSQFSTSTLWSTLVSTISFVRFMERTRTKQTYQQCSVTKGARRRRLQRRRVARIISASAASLAY